MTKYSQQQTGHLQNLQQTANFDWRIIFWLGTLGQWLTQEICSRKSSVLSLGIYLKDGINWSRNASATEPNAAVVELSLCLLLRCADHLPYKFVHPGSSLISKSQILPGKQMYVPSSLSYW